MTTNEEDFITRFERMTIKVKSPDESVSATYSVLTGIKVAIDEKADDRHTEESLARQVQTVVKGIKRGYSSGARKLVGPVPPDPAEDGDQQERRSRYLAKVLATEHREYSPRGYVSVHLRGNGDVSVSIFKRTFDRISGNMSALETDINDALAGALSAMSLQRGAAYRAIYEPLSGG